MRRPIGIVRIRLVERGGAVWNYEGRNLFVNAGRPALAALLGGDTAGEFAAAVGFGSGLNAPAVTDTRADRARILQGARRSQRGRQRQRDAQLVADDRRHGSAGNHDPGAGDLRESCERGIAGNHRADSDARAKDYSANSLWRGNEYQRYVDAHLLR